MLEEDARSNNRTLTAEIIQRLEDSIANKGLLSICSLISVLNEYESRNLLEVFSRVHMRTRKRKECYTYIS
ncbi:Arc family DNA-binding protein [Acetobacter oryzifermentans]|uniref:Arc family DNA-binding protein n=1 Tax=Acetobacter oryzifermentans TaxID=1633874 RepID=UPI0012FF5A20